MLRKKEKGKMVSALKLGVFSTSFKGLNETLAKLKGHERKKATFFLYCFSVWGLFYFSHVFQTIVPGQERLMDLLSGWIVQVQ